MLFYGLNVSTNYCNSSHFTKLFIPFNSEMFLWLWASCEQVLVFLLMGLQHFEVLHNKEQPRGAILHSPWLNSSNNFLLDTSHLDRNLPRIKTKMADHTLSGCPQSVQLQISFQNIFFFFLRQALSSCHGNTTNHITRYNMYWNEWQNKEKRVKSKVIIVTHHSWH